MPEFKVFTTIEAPYSKVWEIASVVENIEKWAPVSFTSAADEEEIRNGLKLSQKGRFFGLFRTELEVEDAYTNSIMRRQFSFVDADDDFNFNRITFMFDDNSIRTMIDLAEDRETKEILEEQAKEEPEYQVKVMAHVFYTLGSSFWRQIVEGLFISPFFKLLYQNRAKKSLDKMKQLSESAS